MFDAVSEQSQSTEKRLRDLTKSIRTRHGLRHSYAARKYPEFKDSGKTDAEAKKAVSPLLGHNRPEVTNNYLAGLKKVKSEDTRNVDDTEC